MKTYIAVILIVLLASLTACAPDPEKAAAAQIAILQAQRDDEKKAIENQWLKADADIRATAQAEIQLQKDKAAVKIETQQKLDEIKLTFTQRLNKIMADYEAQIQAIRNNAQIAASEAQRNVDGNRALGFALVVTAIGVAIAIARAANALVIWVKNRSKRIDPSMALKDGDTIFQPGNSLTTYMASESMPAFFRWLMWLEMWREMRRTPGENHWQQVRDAREATSPRFASQAVENPDAVLRLRESQDKVRMIAAISKKMNAHESKEAAQDLILSAPSSAPPAAPKVGFLPAASQAEMYKALELEAES